MTSDAQLQCSLSRIETAATLTPSVRKRRTNKNDDVEFPIWYKLGDFNQDKTADNLLSTAAVIIDLESVYARLIQKRFSCYFAQNHTLIVCQFDVPK